MSVAGGAAQGRGRATTPGNVAGGAARGRNRSTPGRQLHFGMAIDQVSSAPENLALETRNP